MHYASAGIAIAQMSVRLSVRLSFRLSHSAIVSKPTDGELEDF